MPFNPSASMMDDHSPADCAGRLSTLICDCACRFSPELPAGADGACVPGVYNDVDMPSTIGNACTDDSECYSPLGQGMCDSEFDCTVLDCAAPGMPPDVCGTGNLCIIVTANLATCLRACDAATDCEEGRACADVDGDPMTEEAVCFPFCINNDECRVGETCNTVTGRCE